MKQKDLDLLNEIKDIPIIKQYCELIKKFSTFEIENKPKKYVYKSTEKYDYIVVKPYLRIDMNTENKYYFRKTGYDGEIKSKVSPRKIYLCESLCNKSEDYIKERLNKSLKDLESKGE